MSTDNHGTFLEGLISYPCPREEARFHKSGVTAHVDPTGLTRKNRADLDKVSYSGAEQRPRSEGALQGRVEA